MRVFSNYICYFPYKKDGIILNKKNRSVAFLDFKFSVSKVDLGLAFFVFIEASL